MELKHTWSYHYKVELTDPLGKPIARQLFYKLNTPQLPILFSRSNWSSPYTNQLKLNNNLIKYIIRLNINCRNFEMMLFFYRILFNKCANYSKKDFSLFVLKKILSITDNTEFEYQLSLKQHDSSSILVDDSAKSSLLYKIDDRATFEYICRLLAGYLIEQVKDRVYLVQDPDGNRIYLIDSLVDSHVSITLFNSIGLAEKYFTNIWAKFNSSSSSFNSVDSGNYSTLSSSSSSKGSSGQSQRLAKSIKEYQEFMRHYKKLHKLINKEQQVLESEEAKIKHGVKDLIKRFSCQLDKSVSSQNLNDSDLSYLMKQATPNPISYLNAKNSSQSKEVNINNYMRTRSRSVMAEPFSKQQHVQLSSSSSSSIISSSSLSSISSMSSDSINTRSTNPFDRKKSKSVTFLDSSLAKVNKLKNKKQQQQQQQHENLTVDNHRRSKSTVPFMNELDNYYLTADVDNENEYYTLNNTKFNYLSNEFNLIDSSRASCMKRYSALQDELRNKPKVGVTPETRFRKTPTLDIIRSTKMPLNAQNDRSHLFNTSRHYYSANNNYVNDSNFMNSNKPKFPMAKF